MLTHLAVNRLISGCHAAPLLAPLMVTAARLRHARPMVSCAWSKRDEVVSNWEALRNAPQEWYDNRRRKTNPKAPDFVRRDDRTVAIWVDGRETPEWANEVLDELDARASDMQARRNSEGGNDAYGRQAADLEKWQALMDNPDDWYDNRSRKMNPRAPDFKRKDDKTVALWLDSNTTPDWVGEVLAKLDARQQARRAERAAASQEAYREERYQQADQHMAYEQPRQQRGQGGPDRDAKREAELAKWEAWRSNPAEWYDNRFNKQNPRQPDFRNRGDRTVALWLSSYDKPQWVDDVVAELDAARQRNGGYYQQQQPSQDQQRSPRPDLEAKKQAEAEHWESLRQNPELWYDNRYTKTNPKQPDFRFRDDRNVALWINSYGAPDWLGEMLQSFDAARAQQPAAYAQQDQQQQPEYDTATPTGAAY